MRATLFCRVLAGLLPLTGCGDDEPTGLGGGATTGSVTSPDPTSASATGSATTHVTAASTTASVATQSSASSGSAACDGPPSAFLHTFEVVLAPGASNTQLACAQGCDLAELEATDVYYAHLAVRAHERLAACGMASPTATSAAFPDPTIPPGTTVVVSVDNFFWSACEPTLADDVAAFVGRVQAADPTLPVFVANVPRALADCPDANPTIAAGLASLPGAHVVDIDRYFQALVEGRLERDGVVLQAAEVVPDGLHLSPLGHEIVADIFVDTIESQLPGLGLGVAGSLAILP